MPARSFSHRIPVAAITPVSATTVEDGGSQIQRPLTGRRRPTERGKELVLEIVQWSAKPVTSEHHGQGPIQAAVDAVKS